MALFGILKIAEFIKNHKICLVTTSTIKQQQEQNIEQNKISDLIQPSSDIVKDQQQQQQNENALLDQEEEFEIEVVSKDDFNEAIFIENFSNLRQKESFTKQEEQDLQNFYGNLKQAIAVDGQIDQSVSDTIDQWKQDIDLKLLQDEQKGESN